MPTVDNQQLAVAGIYSQSLLTLAREAGAEDDLLAELGDLVDYLGGHPEVADFFSSPLVDAGARREVIEKTFRGRASDLLVDGLQVLNRKERLGLLPAVAETYRRQHRDLKGIVDVEVKTAVALTPALRERLAEAARRFTGREPHLIEEIRPGLLGGLVVQVGDRKFDASIRSHLQEISRRLDERGSQEIYRGASQVAEPSAPPAP
jgi:F-type H+-transporting ATPase subunit delta